MTEPLRAGATLTLMGDRIRVLFTAADSGGALTALEVEMRPARVLPSPSSTG